MARIWQRYFPTRGGTSRRKAKKPKDVKVSHGGHRRRTVNAPKGW